MLCWRYLIATKITQNVSYGNFYKNMKKVYSPSIFYVCNYVHRHPRCRRKCDKIANGALFVTCIISRLASASFLSIIVIVFLYGFTANVVKCIYCSTCSFYGITILLCFTLSEHVLLTVFLYQQWCK